MAENGNMAANFAIFDQDNNNEQQRNGRRQRTPVTASRVRNAPPEEQGSIQNIRRQLNLVDADEEHGYNANDLVDANFAAAAGNANNNNVLPATRPKNLGGIGQPAAPEDEEFPDQAMIMERLANIHQHKRQVLDMIEKLKREGGEKDMDRDMLRKLVDAYDNFKEQEEQYLSILQKILTLKSQYATALEDGAFSPAEPNNVQQAPPTAVQPKRPGDGNKAAPPRQHSAGQNDAMYDSGFSSAGDAEMQALIEQRNMLKQMLRQQEELRALQGQHKAQQGQSISDIQAATSVECAATSVECELAYQQVYEQQEMLTAKRKELEDLKKKLEHVRSLYDENQEADVPTRDEIPVAAAPRRQQQHHQLEDKLQVLRGKKQRMDEIINELNSLQQSTAEESDRHRIPMAMASVDAGNPGMAAFNQTGARPKQPIFPMGKPVPRGEQQRNPGGASGLGGMPPSEEIRRKLKELEATKSRLAQLQTLVTELEDSGGARGGQRIGVSPQLLRLVNELEVEGEDIEGVGGETGEMAALNMRMKSAYLTKLNEQQNAVERLQEEHARLTAIKNQLLKMNPLSDPLAAERAAERAADMDMSANAYSANSVMGRPAAEDISRDLRQIAMQQRQSESRATPDQRLNNTRDNSLLAESAIGGQLRNTRPPVDLAPVSSSLVASAYEPGTFDEPEIDQPVSRSRRGTDSASSTIVNNPRLASFRRNNQLDEIQKLQHRQPQPASGAQRGQDGGRQATPVANTNMSSDRLSRRRRSSTTIEQQYHQLQQHIDSIRFIFQDLMKDHDEYGGQEQQQQQQWQQQQPDQMNFNPQYRMAQSMSGNQMTSSMTTTPSWDAMPMGPPAFTMQQHQLTLSLLACQQQLQLQQLEMRYLQQLCQELWQSNYEGGRTRSGSVNSVHQQQQQAGAGPMATSGNLPFAAANFAPFDGRPLSSASLYNLLAPNPYLTLPYYPPQFGQQNFASPLAARGLTRNNNGSTSGIHSTPRGAGILNNSCIAPTAAANNATGGTKSNRNAETASISGRMMSTSSVLGQDGQQRGGSLGDRMIVSDSELSIVGETSPFKVGAGASSRPGLGEFVAPPANGANKATVPKLNLDDSYKSNVNKNQNNKNSNMVMTQMNGVIPELPSRASSTSGAVTNSGHVSAMETGYMTPEQFDVMREAIYSEVATLISQNEQRPNFLLELFRELQLLTNDYLRARALEAVRDILNRYLTDDTESNTEQEHSRCWTSTLKNRPRSESDASFRNAAATATPEKDTSRLARSYPLSTPIQVNNQDYLDPPTLSENSLVANPDQNAHVDVSANNSFDKPLSRQKRFENLEGIKDVKDTSLSNATASSFKATSETNDLSRSQSRDFAGASASASSASGGEVSGGSKVDVSGLEQQIQTIIDDLIPFVRGNVDAECSPQLLQYVRKLVLELTLSKCVPKESVSTFFRLQLSSGLDDTLAKFKGQKLHECGAELLADVSEVVFNELAFFRLMQNIDTSFATRGQGADSESSTVDIETRNAETSESAPLDDIVSETNGDRGGSELSSSRQSSLDEELSPMSIPDALSELSEDLSAITAISISRHASKIAGSAIPETETEAADDQPQHEAPGRNETAEDSQVSPSGPKRRKSDSDRRKSTETVLMAPLMVQVTAATDEEEITTTTNNSSASLDRSSSSSIQSMHTAGGGSMTSDQVDMLKTPPTGGSRETTPPDEADEVPEQLENEPTPPIDNNDVTFDLTYEPHPEDKVQLTLNVTDDNGQVGVAAGQNEEEEEEEEEEEPGDIARVRTPTPVMARAVAYLAESPGPVADVDVTSVAGVVSSAN